MKLLISKIAFKIETVLKKLNLVPEIPPAEFIRKTKGKKHRYYSVCGTKEEKKLMFYSRLYNDEYDKKRFVTETLLAQKIMDKKLFSKYFPVYYGYGYEKDFEWLTRQYYRTTPLEDKKRAEKLKRSLSNEDILKIVKAIININALPVKNLDFLKKLRVEKYLNYYKKKDYIFKEAVDIKELERFSGNNKLLLERENKYFCHGDLSIGNVVFLKNRIKIIDLESANINNFAFDIAFFTTRLWQNGKYRENIIKTYLRLLPERKKKIFTILFRINSSFIAYQALGTNPIEYTVAQNKERNIFFEKILKNSTKGFDFLINNK